MAVLIMKNSNVNKKEKIPFWVILSWVALWQFLSVIVNSEILLASPLSVFKELLVLVQEFYFWQAVFFTILRISAGFILAVVIGISFAVVSSKVKIFKQLIGPLIIIAKSVPVASIIVLVILWVSVENIAVFISLIMVMPVVYTNVLSGINNLNKQLAEMAYVFNVSSFAKIRYITVPQIMPFFESACLVGLGMSFKAGIAAEVIGYTDNSIGGNLYQAKIFLDTPTLFAWTLVIIAVSFLFEKLFTLLIRFGCKQLIKVRVK